jgi:5-methylcytosine-specific restriction enzyme A
MEFLNWALATRGEMKLFPTSEQYKNALREVLPTSSDKQHLMLQAHLAAPGFVLTASQLATAAGYNDFGSANIHYGKFCHSLCDALDFVPPVGKSGNPTFTLAIASGHQLPTSDWQWTLRPEFVAAMKQLNAESQSNSSAATEPIYAEEIMDPELYEEGAKKVITVVAYERSKAAREACLEYWGTDCSVCGLDFESQYGVLARRCIHVHHLRPLPTIGASYQIDPEDDLRPVCPNCHAVLHTEDPPMSVHMLRSILRERKG